MNTQDHITIKNGAPWVWKGNEKAKKKLQH
jgi:hypothetical protein